MCCEKYCRNTAIYPHVRQYTDAIYLKNPNSMLCSSKLSVGLTKSLQHRGFILSILQIGVLEDVCHSEEFIRLDCWLSGKRMAVKLAIASV